MRLRLVAMDHGENVTIATSTTTLKICIHLTREHNTGTVTQSMKTRGVMDTNKKCDKLLQMVVMARDIFCRGRLCTKPSVAAHHLFGRKNKATRYNPECSWGLCLECHQQAHLNPREFREFVRSKIGQERYIYLEAVSREVVRLRDKDFVEIAERLRKQLEGMKV